MKNVTFYLILAIIVLAGLTYTFYDLNKKHKANAERWEENFTRAGEEIQQLEMSVNDFKKYMGSKTDSILKIAKIKPKNVTQITNNYTRYIDTTINEIRLDYDINTGTYPFIDKTGCFEFSGGIILDSTMIPQLNVAERKFNSDFTEIEYIRKDTMHFFWLDWVKWWQKPEITYTIIDNCDGSVRVRKINVK